MDLALSRNRLSNAEPAPDHPLSPAPVQPAFFPHAGECTGVAKFV